MFGARFANEGAHVDEARRNDVTTAIDHARVVWKLFTDDGGTEASDHAIYRQQSAASFRLRGGIDEQGVDESDWRV
jgi:hypothetical protein